MVAGQPTHAVSVAAILLHCFTSFPLYLGTLCECERSHVICDILLASSLQCPLPFLPPSCSRSASLLHRLVFSPFTLNPIFPVPPLYFPFCSSHLATRSLVSLTSHFILSPLVFFPPFVFDVHALSHSHDSVTLSLSCAHGLHCVLLPSTPPPPPSFSSFTVSPLPLFSVPLAHSLATAVILPPPPSRWCGSAR